MIGMAGMRVCEQQQIYHENQRDFWGCRYVIKTAPDSLWLAVGMKLSGRVSALDAATNPASLATFRKLHRLGDPVRARVLKVRPNASIAR